MWTSTRSYAWGPQSKPARSIPGDKRPIQNLDRLLRSDKARGKIQGAAEVVTAEFRRKAEAGLKEIESFGVSQDFEGFGTKRITDLGPKTLAPKLIEDVSGYTGQEADERFDLMQKAIARKEGMGDFGLDDEDPKLTEALSILLQIRSMVQNQYTVPANITINNPKAYKDRHGSGSVRSRRRERDLAGSA